MKSVEIKNGSPLHDRIKNAILDRKKFSNEKMKNFHRQWDDADDSMRAYIHEKEVDKKRKDKKRYDGEVDYVTLEVPYIYATIMTAHTYYSSVILSRAPVWQFSARHGEPQNAVQAVEAVMDYQLKVGNHLPVMYNWLYDMAKYSIGVVGTYWDEEERVICNYVDEPVTLLGVPLGGTKRVKKEEVLKGYVGNKLFNIRPYDFYPDPRVPIWRFQDGEFCLRTTSEGYHEIIGTEHTSPGYYINLKELVKLSQQREGYDNSGSPRVELPTQPGEGGRAPGPGFFKITEAYIRLIPSVWGLGDGKRMEVWCFTLAEEEMIIRAAPLGLYHNKFPFSVMEGNFGSEEFAKFGMLETIRPLTDIMTWLVNSHFYNVRRVLNNQLVVDPSRIVMKDLTKPGQRIIRLKANSYGADVRGMVHQLQHIDVTRSNMSDMQILEQMTQRVSSVVDTVMGMQAPGGRKSATEVRSSTGWSTSRLKTPIEYNSALALDPLSQMMLSNTQQFMDFERKYMIAGNMLEGAERFVNVDAAAITGFYDFVPVDGTMPIDRLAQANFWKELLVQMSRIPEFAMQWDIGGMVAHAMKLQGERNIDRFRIQVQPPGAAPGANMIPLQGASNGGGRRNAGNGAQRPRAAGTSGGTI